MLYYRNGQYHVVLLVERHPMTKFGASAILWQVISH